jgi:hypothetical protein
MATRGVIARSYDGKTWRGRYHHFDSYPTGLGVALQDCLRYFNGDIEKMLEYLIDQHPAGWSTILGSDFGLPAGFKTFRSVEEWPVPHQPLCYCHGERNEQEFTITNEDDTDTEFAYVYDFAARKLRILTKRPWGNRWVEGASFDFSDLPLSYHELRWAEKACIAAREKSEPLAGVLRD